MQDTIKRGMKWGLYAFFTITGLMLILIGLQGKSAQKNANDGLFTQHVFADGCCGNPDPNNPGGPSGSSNPAQGDAGDADGDGGDGGDNDGDDDGGDS
jgi:hypothetical protein